MTARTASNLLAVHGTLCLGGWAYGGPTVLLPIGLLVIAVTVAMFRICKLDEGE